jgi:hypothetical protein
LSWKKFGETRSARRLFNQAADHWRRRQFLLKEDEAGAEQACLEVIRLCQLSIQSDEKMGDAYVLLSNALSVAASHTYVPSDLERYEFLQTRAAAVIHFWYTLPHRGYPITKDKTHGERLWRIIFDEVRRDKSLPSEDAATKLMESYRDSLAAEAILPDSFGKIKSIIARTTPKPKVEQPAQQVSLEALLLPLETFNFLVEILPKALQMESRKEEASTDRLSRIREATEKLEYFGRDSYKAVDASILLLDLIKKNLHDKDLRQSIGWLTWLFILQIYRGRYMAGSYTEEEINKQYEIPVEPLRITINVARQAKDYDALLLAAGLCDWIGLSKWSDQILGIVGDEIGKQAIADRLANIKRRPQMLTEDLLIHQLERYLTEKL